jgi:hypothetical protein
MISQNITISLQLYCHESLYLSVGTCGNEGHESL